MPDRLARTARGLLARYRWWRAGPAQRWATAASYGLRVMADQLDRRPGSGGGHDATVNTTTTGEAAGPTLDRALLAEVVTGLIGPVTASDVLAAYDAIAPTPAAPALEAP